MFSNVIGQESVVEKLRNEVSSSVLPNSIIFSGPQYSGKMTTALELARVLNCLKDKRFDCDCESCVDFRLFRTKNLFLLSKRDYYYILNELFESYKIEKSSFIHNRIVYYLKLFFLPFNDIYVNEVFSDSDKKKIESYVEYIETVIDKNEFSSVDIEECLKIVKNISSMYKSENISVDIFRHVIDWAYYSTETGKKVVIIDNADSLEISSENILLKILEEPPPYLYFILIAKNKYNLLQTIRSRCRIYNFLEHRLESVKYIIKHIFNSNDLNYEKLFDFIHRNDELNNTFFYEKLEKLYQLVFDRNRTFNELYNFFDREKDEKIIFNYLVRFCEVFQKNIINEKIKFSDLIKNNIIESATILIKRIETYNLNVKNSVESFFFTLKEFLSN